VIADSTGALKQSMSFDSWGRRREASNWSAMASTVGFDTSHTAKGYTGHETLDDVDVVHMHGRIYDARWGRMLQADPYIQDGSDSQAFNRFAYVNNRPLTLVDPSGYSPCGRVGVGSGGTDTAWDSWECDDEMPSYIGFVGFGGGGGGVDDSGNMVLPTVGGGIVSASRSQAPTPGGTGAGTGELKEPIEAVVVAAARLPITGTVITLGGLSQPPAWLVAILTATMSTSTATDEEQWAYAAQHAEDADNGNTSTNSPDINPSDIAGKSPQEIDQAAREAGLVPKGPDPMNGKGSYVDPVTGGQRVLVHGDHTHVNDVSGNRLDINGNIVPPNSPDAHLPIK
jgi:RHS repeat-associated protein